MNIARLSHILYLITKFPFQKADADRRPIAKVLAMFKEPKGDLKRIDCCVAILDVDQVLAKQYKQELLDILKEFPDKPLLTSGPSFIQVGATLGEPPGGITNALRLFAVGEVLEFWKVRTPRDLEVSEEEAWIMAHQGHVSISPGFDPMEEKPDGQSSGGEISNK